MRAKVYHGFRDHTGKVHVHADLMPLGPRFDLAKHSPSGFEWGYGGSGPAQLALAILADALGNNLLALKLHHPFKWAVIAKLDPRQEWKLSGDEVRRTVARLQGEMKSA